MHSVNINIIRAIDAPQEPRGECIGSLLGPEPQTRIPPNHSAISSLVADHHDIAPRAHSGRVGPKPTSHHGLSLVSLKDHYIYTQIP